MSYRRRIPSFLLGALGGREAGALTMAQWKRYDAMKDAHMRWISVVGNALELNYRLVREMLKDDTRFTPMLRNAISYLVADIGDIEMMQITYQGNPSGGILKSVIQYNHVELARWIMSSAICAPAFDHEGYLINWALKSNCSIEMLDLVASVDERRQPYRVADWVHMCYNTSLSGGTTGFDWIIRQTSGKVCICGPLSNFSARTYDSRIADDINDTITLGSIFDGYTCPLEGCNRREKRFNELGRIICSCL